MSKVIEVVVIGATGFGKFHVLAVIDAALREAYGPHAPIVSRDLSLERGLGGSTTEPSVDTIFHLKERQPGSEPIISTIQVKVDTTAVDTLLARCEQITESVAGHDAAVAELIPGQLAVGSFAHYPLSSAISDTVTLLEDNAVFLAACDACSHHRGWLTWRLLRRRPIRRRGSWCTCPIDSLYATFTPDEKKALLSKAFLHCAGARGRLENACKVIVFIGLCKRLFYLYSQSYSHLTWRPGATQIDLPSTRTLAVPLPEFGIHTSTTLPDSVVTLTATLVGGGRMSSPQTNSTASSPEAFSSRGSHSSPFTSGAGAMWCRRLLVIFAPASAREHGRA